MKAKIDVHAASAREKFASWIATRGGVIVWHCLDIGNNRGLMFTPATTPEGTPGIERKPHWSMGDPEIHTSLDDFRFAKGHREFKRFRVAVRRGDGFTTVLTDASKRKLTKYMDAAGPDAAYHFDYSTQEAVVEIVEWE